MKLLLSIWSKIVVDAYINAGREWGEAISTPFSSEDYTYFKKLTLRLKKWEKRYENLGYIPLHWILWIRSGGYAEPINDYLFLEK